MKSVSVLNMSPSGMRLNFYSLTLRELKLISWTCYFLAALPAGCGLLLRNLSLSPFDLRIRPGNGLCVSFAIYCFCLFVSPRSSRSICMKPMGVSIRDSSDSPTFHEHTEESRHIREREREREKSPYKVRSQTSKLSLQWVSQQSALSDLKNPLK